ncbi:MAG: MCE family protein [Streptosporangiales bacterium]|nr:MCE family protein [Streptosporangiales bacterium]
MTSRTGRTLGALVKLAVFTAASLAVTGLLVAIIGNFGLGDDHRYRAVFTSASRLVEGNDVRVAGVVVGRVEDVRIEDRTRALVTFSAEKSLRLTTATRAQIRYLNLVGDRYLALTEGRGEGAPLASGDTIPLPRTESALDLNTLFNGFKPLFAALSPEEVNRLAYEIIQTLQGEGGTVNSLLAHTASLTSTLADRDQLIGEVIDNLNAVLAALDGRHERLSELVAELQRWVSGLAADRTAIGSSLQHIDELTRATAGLVAEGRPSIREDIAQLGELTATLSEPENERLLEHFVQNLPDKANAMTRTGQYGSWYNFYLCDLRAQLDLPDVPSDTDERLERQLSGITLHSNAARCRS